MRAGIFWSFFFFSSRSRHTRSKRDWSSDVCSSDLDVGVGRAPTDIATHPLGDLGVGEDRCRRNIRRRVAWPSGLMLGQYGDGRTNLAGRAIPALQSVMAHEGGLHRVEVATVCQAFDGRDLIV